MAADDVDASTLMPLDTPPLKVSRPVAACSRCRNAKIKCDGKLPACSSCEKTGRAAECTNTNDEFARGKERSYVSTLETKIERLQARLEEARARKPSVISIPDDETSVPSRRESFSVQEPTPPGPSKAQRRNEASAIDDLVSDFGYLSVNATARDFYGFTIAMSYARLVMSACSKDPFPQGTTKALPPRYVATALIQHYLDNVFVLLPVFHQATLYTSVDRVYTRHSQEAKALDFWMVHMILAIANASNSESRGDQHHLEGIGHVCAALERAEEVLQPGAISSVQALVLLTQYAMLDPHHLDSWSLIGAASRAMVDLGLHQDPPKGASMPKAKLELRRRVFYCVFALDRSTSLVQTRAFSFSDDSTKVKIPFTKAQALSQTSPNQNGHSSGWLQSYEHALDLILLRQLQSIWYTALFQSGRGRWEEPYPYIWTTCDTLRKWFDNLSGSTSQNMRAFFELDLLYSYVYVLSPSPRVPAIDPFAAKLIFEYCIKYADLMLRLISDPSYTAPMTFYDAMRVYMTGRQFLDVLNLNAEALIQGHTPPHPPVRPSAPAPPALPRVSIPPGDNMARFNTARSLHCIKQITECLTKFGMRWGYMSWSQRYQAETAGMHEYLNQRLREMEGSDPGRRPSMWHHASSSGSVHSNPGSMGSIQFSPPQGLAPGPASYRQGSVTGFNMAGFGDFGQVQTSPPAHHWSNTPFHLQPGQPFEPQQQFYQTPFNFAEPPAAVDRHPHANAPPSLQFAGWGGYGGSSGPDTLDEENATGSEHLFEIAPFPEPPSDENISPSTKVTRGTTMEEAVEIAKQEVIARDEAKMQAPTIQSNEQEGESTQADKGVGNRGSRESISQRVLSSLSLDIPSRLSRRRKKLALQKLPTSAPRPKAPPPRPSRAMPVEQADVHTLQTGLSLGGIGVLPRPEADSMGPPPPPFQPKTQASTGPFTFSIPPTSVLPPLEGRGPALPAVASRYASQSYCPAPVMDTRRISMVEAACEFAETFEQPRPQYSPLDRVQSPRLNRFPRQIRRPDGLSDEPNISEKAKGKQPAYLAQRGTEKQNQNRPSATRQEAQPTEPAPGRTASDPIDLVSPSIVYPGLTYTWPPLWQPTPNTDFSHFTYISGAGWACHHCQTVVQRRELHSTDGKPCFTAERGSFSRAELEVEPESPQTPTRKWRRNQNLRGGRTGGGGGTETRDFARP
ncbi:hypothetical protein LTR78_007826 [Recurvomyces mirabilis]|uniref:Zn(2)-C6 fungal-type domain-containing protein n=1 Tax=Recurvomyces mirabilis TaxID=574656 RepID=A0AAE0WJ68_9PEZI|nr:hypothetical protein LTR78_007826 [Recurvomyces mirabilis]KAK5160132.1 hypothetical protein LTS14_002239 [Recurvomyces mirabilis]